MQSLKFFALSLFGIIALAGCQKKDSQVSTTAQVLALMPQTPDMIVSKASGSSFFANGDQINLSIKDRAGTNNYTYSYNNGAFTGINSSNTYQFYMDDEAITTLSTSWPSVRPTAFMTDQRKDADFKTCDYMTATLQNIEATDNYVPISFIRENSKIIFVVTGQNSNGLAIKSLVIDVNNIGFWAHPNPVTGNAELIIPPGDVLLNSGDIAGRITVGNYTGSVIFEMTKTYTLLANTSYIVTLSPSGDNMMASISIGNWYQNENGVGVPIIKQDGYYLISTEAQLFAIHALISGYTSGVGNVDWTSASYMLAGDIALSGLQTWTTLTNFTGVFNYNSHTISPSIVFANGGTIIDEQL